jgi:hypothetical protein
MANSMGSEMQREMMTPRSRRPVITEDNEDTEGFKVRIKI